MEGDISPVAMCRLKVLAISQRRLFRVKEAEWATSERSYEARALAKHFLHVFTIMIPCGVGQSRRRARPINLKLAFSAIVMVVSSGRRFSS